MIINRENLIAINKGFSKVFNESLIETKSEASKIATEVKVNAVSASYAWLGDIPKMREWVGDRVLEDITAHSYEIRKKNWEATIEVDKDDIEYDNLGIVKPRIQALAQESVTHYAELIYGLIEANGTGYDAKPFFSEEHPVGGSVFSNIGNKKLTQDTFIAARQEMMGLVSETGKPLKIRPTILLVPPELEVTAINILARERLANGSDNITKSMAEIVVSQNLTDPNAWYLLDCSRPLKPFILQLTKSIQFDSMDKVDDESVFMRRKYRYGTSAEDNAGYGLWQLAYKSTGEVV